MQSDEAALIASLVEAQRRNESVVDASRYSGLDRETAYGVQFGVMAALGARAGMIKTGIHSDGVGVVSPIYAGNVGRSGSLKLAGATIAGLEVEIGVVLGKDIAGNADVDEAAVAAAVDHYFLGIEVCASRFSDRKAAGLNGTLADNMSSYGHVIGPNWAWTGEVNGQDVRITLDCKEVYAAPAKHGFGTVLASIAAYARHQRPELPLKAGVIITTGSLCGMVPVGGTGHVVASLNGVPVEFDIV
jgi:2-keto-4-pentenoate hydratase